MANASEKPELEDPPSSLRSPVWEHFGFPVKVTDGQWQVDKSKVVCRHCSTTEIGYAAGNTSNMLTHLKRHHPSVNVSYTRKKTSLVQTVTPITSAFKQHLASNSDRAKAITHGIGVFIATGLRPYSVVENAGFKYMIKVLEHRYEIPSRPHFSQKVVPALYEKTRSDVVSELSRVPSLSLTTDSWTSRATESYLTVTVHYISPQWEMRNHVLQTRHVYEQHTSTNLAEHLKEAVNEWKLERPGTTIPVTTDNAKNIVSAVKAAGLGPQIGCFAHTINLASQKVTSINQISRLLGKVRKIVTFFHKSTTAAHILESKQEMLNIPKHSLIQDVPTRWNSSYDMLQRYLEQQAAIYSALTEKPLKNKDIYTLNDEEVAMAEKVIEALKPLKTITTLMSTESRASVSMIIPLKTTVLHSMAPKQEDSTAVREVKLAVTRSLQERYSVCYEFLHKCTALDPRFKALPHIEDDERQKIFSDIITEMMTTTEEETEDATEIGAVSSSSPEASSTRSPPAKKSVMTELFGELFQRQGGSSKPTLLEQVQEEVIKYRASGCLSLEADPLLWWKGNEGTYPHIAKLAKRYLCIPATSVASERVFSTAGDIVIATRSVLSAENVDTLIFLAKNFKLE
ncbi:E3 SUMO-protein ligase ZBED1-like [Polypterus senegalus]|uniref:E3 SUMO-protein ligase ZBED1-like n=1 Tax=Polypterus senegalus TaxID=55291 RepID=UPI001965EA44|nr:E3 SUMO-protein ligase ZBED1-like [Polypterus senegalus]